MSKEIILGIDLGTSNSQAAIVKNNRYTILSSKDGPNIYGKSFPSYVAFTDNGVLIGESARNQAIINPENTIYRAKKYIGTNKIFKVKGKNYTPQQISAYILEKIKLEAEQQLESKISKAVITIPANFSDAQRTATQEAAELAGLQVVRLLHQPTAAALAYDLNKLKSDQKILVFDLGGGTLDVSLLNYHQDTFEVKSTSGDAGQKQLGGTYMDEKIENYFISKFQNQNNLKIDKSDLTIVQRIKDAVQRAKIELSSKLSTNILIPYLVPKGKDILTLNYKFDRVDLSRIIKPIMDQFQYYIEDVLKSANMQKKDVTKLILVGGPCRMPIIKEYLQRLLNIKASTSISPSECVAIGAAKQAGIISGESKQILLVDVTPLSLGIQIKGGIMSKIVNKNSTLPYQSEQMFTTQQDNQTEVVIRVLQGQRVYAKDNRTLSTFFLKGIPPMPRNQPQIKVKFKINRDGILEVTATEMSTKKQETQVIKQTKMSKQDLDKMRQEMQKFEEQDSKIRTKIENVNQTKVLCQRIRNTIKENKQKLKPQTVTEAEQKIKEIENFLEKQGNKYPGYNF
jgi:molecular chaperone DnaK